VLERAHRTGNALPAEVSGYFVSEPSAAALPAAQAI
jgi:hypothetical protein